MKLVAPHMRLTYRYVNDYAHMDLHEPFPTEVRVVRSAVNLVDERCEEWFYRVHLRTVAPVAVAQVCALLSSEYSRGCACEHDCCGCIFGGARYIKPANRRGTKWTAVIAYCRNY